MIVVNPATRQFNIPGSDQVFGVTDDASSEIRHFQCPRYVGNNVDVAGSFVRINYRNGNGEIDSYLVQDITVDGNNVLFDWVLSKNATMYKGNINFVMCVVGSDTKVKWHTTIGRGQVLEGLEPDSHLIEEATVDVIAQLIALVEAQTAVVANTGADQVAVVKAAAKTAQDSAVAQIEAKGASTLATIPSDYTTIQNAVRGAANAIRGKVSGEAVRMDDVSPMEHHPAVMVHGKNLIPYPYYQNSVTQEGVTFTALSDGGVQVSGTPTGYTSINLYQGSPLIKTGNAILSCSGNFTNIVLAIAIYDSNNNVLLSKEIWPNNPPLLVDFSSYHSAAKWTVYLKRGTPGVEMSGVVYPQLEFGKVATTYAPYINPAVVKVAQAGRNLLDPSKIVLANCTAIENGVKASIGGIYYCEIYANHLRNYLQNHDGTSITFSVGNLIPDGYIAIVITYEDGSYAQKTSYTNSATLKIDNQGRIIRSIIVRPLAKRETFTDTTSIITNLQLEIGDAASDFEKSKAFMETVPNADGTVTSLKSVFPTMTLMTDKAGVTIDCEYSRDTNKVIEDILNKLAALVSNT